MASSTPKRRYKTGWTTVLTPNSILHKIRYTCNKITKTKKSRKSLSVLGIDTEADRKGKCFMVCTSEGDVWKPNEWLDKITAHSKRGYHFVAYNLKYDSGALLQTLPLARLEELRKDGKTEHLGITYKAIAYKYLSLRKNHHTVTIWDMKNFYEGSLNYNAKRYLNKKKDDLDPTLFTKTYIKKNWNKIAKYCIKDSILVKELADLIIRKFEQFGVYPTKLYSTAYITFQYFSQHTDYVTLRKIWYEQPNCIDYAQRAYAGGKFEVTTKGPGYYYLYDIVSAYPYEISKLVDIRYCDFIWEKKYRPDAWNGFIECYLDIPQNVYSPVPIKINGVNQYPAGGFTKIITKTEYDYFLEQGCEFKIKSAVWIIGNEQNKPYEHEIKRLVKLKQQFKSDKDGLDYHTIKILLNSLYGKFVQLIYHDGYYRASTCYNVIYGAIVTANTRVAITRLQQQHPEVVAVHTDSIISTKNLNIHKTDTLGALGFEAEGDGIIIGSGVYQVGDKSKIRGFNTETPLTQMCDTGASEIQIPSTTVNTWRMVAHRNDPDLNINEFIKDNKKLSCNFDVKRIWLNDFRSMRDALKRKAESIAHHVTRHGYL